jgi:hypothetical protein
VINPRCLYFIDDFILLNENVSNNGKFEGVLYQIHTGGEIVNQNNISRRPALKILSKCRDTDSRIFLIFSDFQMLKDIKNDRNKNDGDNNYKKKFSLIRRSISIISLIFCEKKLANIDKAN